MPLLRLAEAVRGRVATRYVRARYAATTRLGPGSYVRGRLLITGAGRVEVGAGVFFDDRVRPPRIHVAEGATVRIGDHCYVNGLEIHAQADVTIGNRCILGDAQIITTNFHSTRIDRHEADVPVRVAAVQLGANVWLAGQAAVMPGVTIGDDSVVAFRSVIFEDVPPGVIVTSHAQRVLRELRH